MIEGHSSENSKQYTVRLATQPTSQVLVTLGGHEGPDFTASASPSVGGLMIFTTDNWGSDVTVTVTVTNDLIDEDSEMSDITHAVRGGDYGAVTALPVSVTVEDNDTAAVTIETVSTIAREDGVANASYTVKLDTQPTDTVTITPDIGTNADVTLDPPSLEFSTTDWETPQTITVMAVNDDIDDDGESVTITHMATSADPKYDSSLSIGTVTVMITDDDTAGVSVNPGQLTLIEGSMTESTKEYTFVLTSEPTGNVTVGLTPSSVNAFTTDRQSFTFTPGNWNMAVTVIVTVVDDDIDEATVTGLQRLTVTSNDPVYQALPANSIDISIVVRDDDERGVTVTESVLTGLTVNEEGATAATYTVVLTSQPTHTVTITPDIGANTDVTFSPAFLEFLPSQWADEQTVTVTAVDDDSDEDDESLTITHSASSSDRKYSSSETNNPVTIENVAVMIMDNDDAGVEIVSSLTVDEGSTGTIAVKLTSAPSDDRCSCPLHYKRRL